MSVIFENVACTFLRSLWYSQTDFIVVVPNRFYRDIPQPLTELFIKFSCSTISCYIEDNFLLRDLVNRKSVVRIYLKEIWYVRI